MKNQFFIYFRKSAMVLSFLLILFSCTAQQKEPDEVQTKALKPWLAKNGQFGFVDTTTGELKISPQYDDAHSFKNGFAVVGKAGKYGVINTENETIIPIKYPKVKLSNQDGFPLVITKKEYNAWWQFWQWKILPEWSLMSNHTGPFLVTKVPKAKWTVRGLPGKKKLNSFRKMDTYSGWSHSYWKDDWTPSREIPEGIEVRSSSPYVAVNDKFYKYVDGKFSKVKLSPKGLINDSTVLIKKRGIYRVSDLGGNTVNNQKYKEVSGIDAQSVSGDSITIPQKREGRWPYPVTEGPILQNEAEEAYIFPDLSLPFPQKIANYQHDTIALTGKEILKSAATVLPRPDRLFTVLSGAGPGKGWKTYFLKEDGTWKNEVPPYRATQKIMADGSMTVKEGWLDSDLHLHQMPINRIQPVPHHDNWYIGRDTASQKYGVYDDQKKAWHISPKYSALQHPFSSNLAVYKQYVKDGSDDKKRERSGVLNLKTGEEIIPPKYYKIQSSGRVTEIVKDEKINYYIDLESGKEYRED